MVPSCIVATIHVQHLTTRGNKMRRLNTRKIWPRLALLMAFTAGNIALASEVDHREFDATLHVQYKGEAGQAEARTFTLNFPQGVAAVHGLLRQPAQPDQPQRRRRRHRWPAAAGAQNGRRHRLAPYTARPTPSPTREQGPRHPDGVRAQPHVRRLGRHQHLGRPGHREGAVPVGPDRRRRLQAPPTRTSSPCTAWNGA
jgi:hypothetical protein